MSQELRSASGRLITIQQGDGNYVMYPVRPDGTTDTAHPIADEWGWLARGGHPIPPPTHPPQEPPGPPDVPPTTGTGASLSEIRVTDERDGELLNRGYATLSQAWVSGDVVTLFVGHVDGRPRFFSVDLHSGEFKRLGPLLPDTGVVEGLYWDAHGRISLCVGPRLLRVNPFTHEQTVLMDISAEYPGHDLWQAHSSDDGQTHSATVRQVVSTGAYPKIGTLVSRRGRLLSLFAPPGVLDESQVDPTGKWCVVKVDDDMYVINIEANIVEFVTDRGRALGHSDCGPGFAIGEADKPDPGACVYWDFTMMTMRILFPTTGMGHVSVRAGRCLQSNPTFLNLVALDGSVVTPLLAHGMVGSGYDFQPNGNLSPCAKVVMWMSNKTGRMDAYIGELT